MLVKTLERKDGSLFVECEIGRYIGICSETAFINCMLQKEAVVLDGQNYYHVDKSKIVEVCKK